MSRKLSSSWSGSGLDHPNIVRYLGTIRDEGSLFIFLEYVPGGNMASLVARFGPLPEAVIRIYTRQLLEGLSYLHAQRTVHRDIKGANLLIEKDGRLKLADFGMAKQMVEAASFTKSFKGSAFWMAPEVIRQQGHGVAADVWSVGCTVLEMATGRPPWSQCTSQVQAIFKIASSQALPAVPEALSPEATEFVLLCLQRDPARRPSAQELLRHPFVAVQGDRFIPALWDVTAMEGLGLAASWGSGGRAALRPPPRSGGAWQSGVGPGSSGGAGRRPRLLFGGLGPAGGGAGSRRRPEALGGYFSRGGGSGAMDPSARWRDQADSYQQQQYGPHHGSAVARGDVMAAPARPSRRGTRSESPSSHGGHLAAGLVNPAAAHGLDDEQLAALVLGGSSAAGWTGSGGGGGLSGHGSGGAETFHGLIVSGGGGALRSGAGGGGIDARTQQLGGAGGFGGMHNDTEVEFASQPQLFRVRGLLSLPPLRIPQGSELPFARFQPLNSALSAAQQQPAAAAAAAAATGHP